MKTQIYHSEDEYLFPLQQSVSVQRQKLRDGMMKDK